MSHPSCLSPLSFALLNGQPLVAPCVAACLAVGDGPAGESGVTAEG